MILDSSALVAIALREEDHERLATALDGADIVGVGAPTLVETGIVLRQRIGETAGDLLGGLIANIGVVAFGEPHWREALSAWQRFGRGRHPARLNFGDCLAYATARVADEPLLAKGSDFAQTDVALIDY